MNGRRTIIGGALLLMALGLPGCGVEETAYPTNTAPETVVAIQGDSLRSTHYHTILAWWGTDVDGRVTGYAYRWSEPWVPAEDDSLWWEDSTWTFTTATRDTFNVPTAGDSAERRFEVRAIDDALLADPTPATQVFPFHNFVPSVTWTDTLRHPTIEQPSLPAISFAWTPVDYDGPETLSHARMWLDWQEGEDAALCEVTVVGDTVGAFFPENFQGRYGERTVWLQIFDQAGTGSNVLEWTWGVVPPSGEYLVIDNAWGNYSQASQQDQFWSERMETLLPGNYHVYDVDVEGVFRSEQEVLPIFRLFKGVLWYGIKWHGHSENVDRAMRLGLELAEGSLEAYAADGGNVLITGHNLVGTEGGLSRDFWLDTFGIEEVYYEATGEEPTSNFQIGREYFRFGPLFGGADSLKLRLPSYNNDVFRPSPSLEPLLWLDPAVLDTTDIPEHAVLPAYAGAIAEIGSGRIGLCTTMLTDFISGESDVEPDEAVDSLLVNFFHLTE